MLLDGAQGADLSVRTGAINERSLPGHDESEGTWGHASQAVRDRVAGIRTLLALLRRPRPE